MSKINKSTIKQCDHCNKYFNHWGLYPKHCDICLQKYLLCSGCLIKVSHHGIRSFTVPAIKICSICSRDEKIQSCLQ